MQYRINQALMLIVDTMSIGVDILAHYQVFRFKLAGEDHF